MQGRQLGVWLCYSDKIYDCDWKKYIYASFRHTHAHTDTYTHAHQIHSHPTIEPMHMHSPAVKVRSVRAVASFLGDTPSNLAADIHTHGVTYIPMG